MNRTTSILPENRCQDLSFCDRLVQPDPQVARCLCELIPARYSYHIGMLSDGCHTSIARRCELCVQRKTASCSIANLTDYR